MSSDTCKDKNLPHPENLLQTTRMSAMKPDALTVERFLSTLQVALAALQLAGFLVHPSLAIPAALDVTGACLPRANPKDSAARQCERMVHLQGGRHVLMCVKGCFFLRGETCCDAYG